MTTSCPSCPPAPVTNIFIPTSSIDLFLSSPLPLFFHESYDTSDYAKALYAYCGLDPSLKINVGKVTSTVRVISIQPLTWLLLTLHAHWIHAVAFERSSSDFLRTSSTILLPISKCAMIYKKSEITKRTESMNQHNVKTNSNNAMHSLFSRIVIDRTRRMIPHDNPTTELVTYTIQDGYTPKNGNPSYTLNIQRMELSRGEHF